MIFQLTTFNAKIITIIVQFQLYNGCLFIIFLQRDLILFIGKLYGIFIIV